MVLASGPAKLTGFAAFDHHAGSDSGRGCAIKSGACDVCLRDSSCSWCSYSDAAGAAASACVFSGGADGQRTSCREIRGTCPVETAESDDA